MASHQGHPKRGTKRTLHPTTKVYAPLYQPTEPTKAFIPPTGNWSAKLQNNQITLNAAALHPKDVADKIRHEIGHLVYRDKEVRSSFQKLWDSLPERKQKQIRKAITGKYPTKELKEEAQVQAFESLFRENKNLWEKLLEAIERAWTKITGGEKIPRKEIQSLSTNILKQGITKLKKEDKDQEIFEIVP